MFYAYILQSIDESFIYKGMTNNLERRLFQHNSGKVTSTKRKRPLRIIYSESFNTRKEAREKEKFFKSGIDREYIKKYLAI